jgi:hypothetical protein
MTRLESILQGIENLPISDRKKNEYMLEILYEADEVDKYFINNPFRMLCMVTPSASLNASLKWSGSFQGYKYYEVLYAKLLLRNA